MCSDGELSFALGKELTSSGTLGNEAAQADQDSPLLQTENVSTAIPNVFQYIEKKGERKRGGEGIDKVETNSQEGYLNLAQVTQC